MGRGGGEEEKGDYDDGDEGGRALRRRTTTQDGSKRATTRPQDDTKMRNGRCRSLGPSSSDPPRAFLELSRGPPQTAKEGPKGPSRGFREIPEISFRTRRRGALLLEPLNDDAAGCIQSKDEERGEIDRGGI